MTRLVLDASVALKWYFAEPASDAARRIQQPAYDLCAPELLLLECANAPWKRIRRRELDAATGDAILNSLRIAPIQWHDSRPLVASAFSLALQSDRSVYDCVYLALAVQRGDPLVTADRMFHDALKSGPLASHVLWVDDLP